MDCASLDSDSFETRRKTFLRKENKVNVMKFQPPRGTRDYLPEDMRLRRKVFEKMRGVFESYGYGEVSTPAFEDFNLLAKKSGPEIEKEIYVFKDKSGRKLGLRFDPTVPICRILASIPSLTKPVKFYYLTNMWRYDRPQKGRMREFWQSGVELIGSPKPEADAEIIKIVSDCLKSVGIKNFYFRINSRGVVESLVKKAGIPEKKKFDTFRAIDKLAKIGESGVRKELERYVGKEKAKKFLTLLKVGSGEVEELDEIMKILKSTGIKNVEIDFSIVRGIDYYTGFVFETFIKGREDLGSVASGGRYDTLVKLYGGQDLPATGFGIGVERIMEIVKSGGRATVKALIANVNESFLRESLGIAEELRKGGISCETNLMGRSIRKQLDYANTKEIPFVVFVGEKEVKSRKFTLRDMKSGRESKLSAKEITKKLV